MNTSPRRRGSREEYKAHGCAAAANVAPSGPDARLGYPPTTYIARYVPPMMARVTHDGNIVPDSQRYLQFRVLKSQKKIEQIGVLILLLQLIYQLIDVYTYMLIKKIDNTYIYVIKKNVEKLKQGKSD